MVPVEDPLRIRMMSVSDSEFLVIEKCPVTPVWPSLFFYRMAPSLR